MAQTRARLQASGIAGLFALAFLGALFCTSLATPAIWFYIIYGGIIASSAVAIYRWRVERRRDAKASAAGLWIVVAVIVLFLLLCIILPGL
jgi:phosphatidylglycerophosphate synthase